MDSKMEPSMCFTGSGVFKYRSTEHLEPGAGRSLLHSISAMQHYQHISIEELRMEDYKASGGLFGSKIAKLGSSFCVPPTEKLTPYCYGLLYKEAISAIPLSKPEESKIVSLPANTTDISKVQNSGAERTTVNLTFHGQPNVTVVVQCGSDVNFSFKDNLALAHKSSESKENLKSGDRTSVDASFSKKDPKKYYHKSSSHRDSARREKR